MESASATLKTIGLAICVPVVLLIGIACERHHDTASATSLEVASAAAQPSLADHDLPGTTATMGRFVPQPAPRLDGAATFSVLCWNLEWFFDNESGDNYSSLAKEKTAPSRAQWDWRRDQVADALSRAQPAIAALQEVENKRVLWYLTRSLARAHELAYKEICVEGNDVFTEQDVGFLYRSASDTSIHPGTLAIEPIWTGTFGRSAAMRREDSFADLSKHLCVEYELSLGEQTERITVVTLHLRAKEEAVEIRTKQARTAHAWVADRIRAGENVMLLGDFNTDEKQIPAVAGSDMFAACGFETSDPADDLVDLHGLLPVSQRQTHLLAGKSFDRILVSPSLLEDNPSRADLSLIQFDRLQALSVKGSVDLPEKHWDRYWDIDDGDRDISDHWPLLATFQFK